MIYLDNAATTKPFKEHNFNLDFFFNPSSSYANKINIDIYNVKKKIAQELSTNPKNIIFTSGGTEANNLAITGYTQKKESKFNIAYLGFEHKSIVTSINNLENKGYKCIKIDYKLFPQELENQIGDNLNKIIEIIKEEKISFLILSHLYSESGIILSIDKIVNRLKKEFPRLYIHLDAVQSFLKIKFNSSKIDSISISAHKIHGIKGIGALVLKNNQKISPILVGGKQNEVLRAGTENILGIYSLGLSIDIWQKNRVEFKEKLTELREYFNLRFKEKYFQSDKIIQITPNNNSHIITLGLKDLFAEHIIRYLNSKDIYVSSGSACNNQKDLPNFLKYIKIDKSYHNGILRVSFSIFNTKDDIDKLFINLEEALLYF